MREPEMQKPDNLEKGIRFVCGFVLGFFISAIAFIQEIESLAVVTAISIGIGVVLGFIAMRKGDEFWYGIKNWLSW